MTHTLYATLGSGNSFKPFLTMKQLGTSFRTVFVDVIAGETRTPYYRSINPAGTVPYIELSDGHRLGESNAMAWYLAEGSRLEPALAFKPRA